ncbi:hypothetical protein BJ973_001925 [Actinoplanes tereljensis]|uniref:Uncharacterized protein n=1 Tax=Paractinoplanes tereljensis TaxID=571912 RepID=A0A919NKH7_9ACTN|nr:hypothetical protein [Actinoplanes tereljensis]GIF20168.1 hypothetical protein Ate02nite_28980 [Actinoplanes tereljensis]
MKRRSVLMGSGLILTAPLLRLETAPLTNLSHLDFLRDRVTPPAQAGHTTYGGSALGVLWTYAEPNPDGTYRRIGGGAYDPATDTYGQGAYNADDIARAAVVYLRHWQQTGLVRSRDASRELLRGLTYLQSPSGNVVLWMQPDGTLHPSAEPPELPDPSDSGPSYWLARTVWALGEGYAAWRTADPAFATFLRQRLDLAIAALDRQVLTRYGTWQTIDGTRAPAWLIVDGADATAEAVLGLAAYVSSGGSGIAKRALRQFAEGIAAMAGGGPRSWPFGAVRPWALSLSDWHAWGSQMPAALARAGEALGDARLMRTAVTDGAVFTPWLLTSGGPDNGRLPTRVDRSQIAYGVDSRLQSLLAVPDRPGLRQLAGIVAAWYFGANAAGVPAYDPATGRTVDGISGDGTVNRNAGAESTIHGLLSMLALDAHPGVASIARQGHILDRAGTTTLEAEQAVLTGGATVVTPASAWTGESAYSNGAYVRMPAGAAVRWQLPELTQPHLVLPVANLQPDSAAITRWSPGGVLRHRIGAQGTSPAPGALLPVTLPGELLPGRTDLTAIASGGEAILDAVMLEPLISRYVIGGNGHTTALLRSAATTPRTVNLTVTGTARATIDSYDATGIRRATATTSAMEVRALVLPGGFTIIRR